MIANDNNASTLFSKLDPHRRDKLDRAIADGTPPTYTACYQQFNLAQAGISYSAFYRYARRLRTTANMSRLAELTIPESENPEKLLPRFICQQLVGALLTEEAAPRDIERLTNAYRMAAQVQLARLRLHLGPDGKPKPVNDPQAPWNRKEDGTPYSHQEFIEHLHSALQDNYDLPNRTNPTRRRFEHPTLKEAYGFKPPSQELCLTGDAPASGDPVTTP